MGQYVDRSMYQKFARERLGFEFNDIELLITALTHRSYVNEHRDDGENNERLEYLGDAVLELMTSDYLFKNFPEMPEGEMTAVRAKLVRTESICESGKELGYEPLVRMSRGEQNRGTLRAHDSIYADCFEAVTGAIYVDQGWQAAQDFIARTILVKVDEVLKEESWRDPKSHLQELSQQFEGKTPSYRTLREEGPDHNKTFTVAMYIGGKLMGMGTGHSKQDAQEIAARQGIKYYKKLEAELLAAAEEGKEGEVVPGAVGTTEPGGKFDENFDDNH